MAGSGWEPHKTRASSRNHLHSFRLEPELVIKLAKRGARVFEVPISYAGRTYQEGKKINWLDGAAALSTILRFGISDNLFTADEHGSHPFNRLSRAPRFKNPNS